MAWNEPGDNSNDNNRDPWGGRRGGGGGGGDRKGPLDPDEAFHKPQDSLDGLSDGKERSDSSSGSGFGGKGGSLGLFGIGLVILTVLWLHNAICVVDEQEQAVILRFGRYYETVGPGLNFYFPPIDKYFQENVTHERAHSKQGQMLTENRNIVEVSLIVQYKTNNLQDSMLNVDQPEVSLQQATESALRHVAGSTTMNRILTGGHEQIVAEVRECPQRSPDAYRISITVIQVNTQSTQAPCEVQEAFDDVIRAREDEQRERNQAEAYANGVVPEARGQAQRTIEEANGYCNEVIPCTQGEADHSSKLLMRYHKAPEVTREHLYLDVVQEVFSQTSRVLMTGQQGQNNLLYPSLDKMTDGHNATLATGAGTSAGGGSASASGLRLQTVSDLRQQDACTRKSR